MLPCVIHTGQWSYFWLDSFQTSFHRRFRVAKSSLRLAFLLRVDGLFLSCILVVALVSKEKVKVATMVTKILNTLPWLDSVWQRSGTTLAELFCPFLADWMPHHGRLFIYIVQWLDLIEKSGRAQSNWKSKFTGLTPGGTKPLFVRLLITIVRLLNLLFANGSPQFLHSDAHQSIKLGRNCKLCKYALQQCSCTRLKFAQT